MQTLIHGNPLSYSPPSTAVHSVLKVQGLTFRIGSRALVQGANLCLNAGEFWAILGPNGAGKSTLAKLLAGEQRPNAGLIELEGKPLSDYTRLQLAQRRAYLPQQSRLAFDYTIEEVVEMGLYPYAHAQMSRPPAERVAQCLAQVGMEAYAGRGYLKLSGGEQQRVHLARVLAQLLADDASHGKLLLLDEPTASLDPRHQLQVLETARTLAAQGVAVLAVLHDVGLAARFAPHILLMQRGIVTAAGPAAHVLTSENLSALYGLPCRLSPDAAGDVAVRFG